MFFVFSYWFTAVGLPGCSHFGLQLVRVVLLVPKSLLRWSPDLQWGLQTRTRTTFTYCSPRWWSWCSSAGSQSLRRLSSKHFANENICLDKCIKFSLIKNTCRNHCDFFTSAKASESSLWLIRCLSCRWQRWAIWMMRSWLCTLR